MKPMCPSCGSKRAVLILGSAQRAAYECQECGKVWDEARTPPPVLPLFDVGKSLQDGIQAPPPEFWQPPYYADESEDD